MKKNIKKQINLKLSEDTLKQLDLKASKMGLSRTAYIKLIAIMDVEFQLVGSPKQTA